MPVTNEYTDGFASFLRSQGRQPATIESYCHDANRFLDFLASQGVLPNRADPEALVAFRTHLEESGREKENTIRRTVIGIRQFYRYLVNCKMMVSSPFDEVPIPERRETPAGHLDSDEIARLIQCAIQEGSSFVGRRNAALIALLAYEGMKATEVIALNWSDLSLAQPASVKILGTKSRLIHLTEETSKLLRAYREDYLALDETKIAKTGPQRVFVAFQGREGATLIPKLSRHGLKFVLYELGNKIGLGKLNAERLRHHAMRFLLAQGKSPEETMTHLGLRRLGNIRKHLTTAAEPEADESA